MVQIARPFGPYIVVDGAQGAVHCPLDVVQADVDFYLFSGHKIYGPTGVGVLYGKQAILETMPPLQGGGDMVDEVTFTSATYQEPPLRFEAGTPMIASVIGLGAAIDYLTKANLSHEIELLDYTLKSLATIPGLTILGSPQKRAPLVTFTLDGIHPLDLANLLSFKKIAIRTGTFCAQPLMASLGLSAACRISLGLYNTKEEIDVAVDSMLKIRELEFV
jgi:cysteine desulfurase/selenocysteine lyase